MKFISYLYTPFLKCKEITCDLIIVLALHGENAVHFSLHNWRKLNKLKLIDWESRFESPDFHGYHDFMNLQFTLYQKTYVKIWMLKAI